MEHTVLNPVGIELIQVDVAAATGDQVIELQRLLAEHGVAVMRGQTIDDSGFVEFLGRFGDLMFSPGEAPLAGFGDLNVISNVGRSSPPRSVFHVDTSYVRRPPAYTALRAVRIPVQGGETLFTNQYWAYETLPARIKDTLIGRTVTHVVTGLALDPNDEAVAEHPAVQRHPISGRRALYLSTPQRCVAVSGMSQADAVDLIALLYNHSTQPANIYRHVWAPGDVVMWDNRCVLHRADHTDVIGDRVMHRGMVAARVA